MKKPTIKDVARLAQVSVSTVSLVINEKTSVSEKTKTKIQIAIKELNYYPRRIARGLASHTTGNIGFILTDDHFSLVEPFYTKIFLGTEFEARKHNYYILLTTVPTKFDQKKSIPRFLLEKNVDAVIMAGRVPERLIEIIIEMELPVILVDYYNRRFKTAAVLIDNIEGAYQAVNHLIHSKHKKIGFIGGDLKHPSIADRYDGYKKALMDNNISLNKNFVVTHELNTSIPTGYNAMHEILKKGDWPTAIFAANDAMAIGCMKRLKEEKIRIPEQVAIIGFDDIDADIQIEPHLSSIRVKKEEMGAIAAKQVVTMIKNKKHISEKILAPTDLIVRASTKSNSNL